MNDMFTLEDLSSQIMYASVMLLATLGNGEESVGTGFFFNFAVDNERHLPVLVTNKHAVSGAVKVRFMVHEGVKKEHGKSVPSSDSFSIEIPGQPFIECPGDVDLCAMPFEPLRQGAQSKGKEIFYVSLTEGLIPSVETLQKLNALEEVVMVGYPIGLWDSKNNFPIIRKGITASHPYVDFDGKPIGVADIASFPGSSGSPVLILNQGSYSTGGGLVIGSRSLLLGILFAGPQYEADGSITIQNIPTRKAPGVVATTKIPVHLGYYIKAKELANLKAHVLKVLQIK